MSLTPCRDARPALEHFRYPQARALGRLRRQRFRREEAAGDDLVVRFGQTILPEMLDDVDCDMITAGNMAVEEQVVQLGIPGQSNPSLLQKLAAQRAVKASGRLNSAG